MSGRRGVVLGLLVGVLAGCSSSQHVRVRPGETLPPLPPTVTRARATSTTVVVTYVVQAGDTFGAIASRLGVDADTLAELNGIVDRNRLVAGQVLQVPGTSVPGTSVAVTQPGASRPAPRSRP